MQKIFDYTLVFECGCDEDGSVPAHSPAGAENALSKLAVCEECNTSPATIEVL